MQRSFSAYAIAAAITWLCQVAHPLTIYAQAPAINWQNTIGGNKTDFINFAQSTPDGGLIAGCTSYSGISGDKTIGNYGLDDCWLLKQDAWGQIEWQKDFGGTSSEGLIAIDQTSDGGYILGANSFSPVSGNKTSPNYGLYDCWVIKLNLNGSISWQQSLGGSLYDNIYAIHQTPDGGFIVGARSNSPISGNKTEPAVGVGNYDYWIIKLDAAGNIEWQNTIGTAGNDYLMDLQISDDGNYIVAGWTEMGISGDKTEGAKGLPDYWILKISNTGSILWQNTIGGSGADHPSKIASTPDGGYIVFGYSESNISGDKTENRVGMTDGSDFWIVKLNADGSIQWQNTIGGYNYEYTVDGIVLDDNGYLVAGYSGSGISGDKTEGSFGGVYDGWIIRLDVAGNIVWQKTIGGNKDDKINTLSIATDGAFLLGAESNSDISGLKTEGNIGLVDFWVLKLNPETCPVPFDLYIDNITATKATAHWDVITAADSYQIWYRPSGAVDWMKKTTAVNFKTIKSLLPDTDYEYKVRTKCTDGEFSEFSAINSFTTMPLRTAEMPEYTFMELYPNPASDFIQLEITAEYENGFISITDMTGAVVFNKNIFGLTTVIDISSLSSGLYIVNVLVDDHLQTSQLIKQ